MTIADRPALPAAPADPAPRRFTRAEYYRMADAGMFEGQHVELINGEILRMSPQGSPHALCISIITSWLARNLPPDFAVRCQLPLVAGDGTEPEPDFAVLPGAPATHRDHPHTALLVIEVAHATLGHDRRKAGLYASVGVHEYWIVNLAARNIEVYRQPQPDVATEFGHRYASLQTYSADQSIQPRSVPLAPIAAAALFPAA